MPPHGQQSSVVISIKMFLCLRIKYQCASNTIIRKYWNYVQSCTPKEKWTMDGAPGHIIRLS